MWSIWREHRQWRCSLHLLNSKEMILTGDPHICSCSLRDSLNHLSASSLRCLVHAACLSQLRTEKVTDVPLQGVENPFTSSVTRVFVARRISLSSALCAMTWILRLGRRRRPSSYPTEIRLLTIYYLWLCT